MKANADKIKFYLSNLSISYLIAAQQRGWGAAANQTGEQQ